MYLVLVIYNENNYYRRMMELQQEYLKPGKNFDVYYVEFRKEMEKNSEEDIIVKNNIICIKGCEHLLQITKKTIIGLDYLLNTLGKKYDFVIRTNISTLINFDVLEKELQIIPKNNVYATGNPMRVNNLDYRSGINKGIYHGTEYAHGTCIIMSIDIVNDLIENKDNIDESIVDDVTFALYLKEYNEEAYKNLKKYKFSSLFMKQPFDYSTDIDFKAASFIRTKSCRRKNLQHGFEIYEKIIKTIYS